MSTKRFGVETSKTLGVRLPLDELALIEGAAAGAGQKPGVWAREVLLKAAAPDKPEWLGAPCPGCSKPIEVVVIGPDGTTCWDCFRRLEAASNEIAGGEPGGPRPTGHLSPSAPGDDPPANHSWSSEWSAMERMEPSAAMARLNELRAGRELPDGFRGWPKAGKISWLDRHWPIGGER